MRDLAQSSRSVAIGVASIGALDEGGFNGVNEPLNNFHRFERIGRIRPIGIGADLWREPGRLVEAAVALDADHVSFTVEWTRVEPERGQIAHDALERYRTRCEQAKAQGLSVEIRLWHFATPAWLGEEYWLFPGSPERFARFAAHVLECLGSVVDRVVVLTRPVEFVVAGWLTGQLPPGRRFALRDALCVLDNLLTAARLVGERCETEWPDLAIELGVGSGSADVARTLVARSNGAATSGLLDSALTRWSPNRSGGRGGQDVGTVTAIYDLTARPRHVNVGAIDPTERAVYDDVATGTDVTRHLEGRHLLTLALPRRFTFCSLVGGRGFTGGTTEGIYRVDIERSQPGITWTKTVTERGDASQAFIGFARALRAAGGSV